MNIIDVEQAAAILRCSPHYIYKLIKRGKLHSDNIASSRVLFIEESFMEQCFGDGYKKVTEMAK